MNTIEKANLIARAAGIPEVKPALNKGGRPPRKPFTQSVQQIIDDAAPFAADLLRQHVERRRGHHQMQLSLQRACEYIIDHAIGKARQKIEHSGGILTYAQLAKSAEGLDTKPREILANTEELSSKSPSKN